MTLDPHGFQLLDLTEEEMLLLMSSSSDPADSDPPEHLFLQQDWVLDHYYPLCEQIVRRALQQQQQHAPPGLWIRAFDHNVRMQQPPPSTFKAAALEEAAAKEAQKADTVVQAPLGLIHGDYTAESALRRVQLLSQPPKTNDMWRRRFLTNSKSSTGLVDPTWLDQLANPPGGRPGARRRWALINVWKSLDVHQAVQSLPLACCQAPSVHRSDLRKLFIHYVDRLGENYLAVPADRESPNQQEQEHDHTEGPGAGLPTTRRQHAWMFAHGMTHQEVLLIKQWDSAGGLAQGYDQDDPQGISSFCLHSAFALPDRPPGSSPSPPPPRQSIEVRCLCIWPPEPDESLEETTMTTE